MNSRLGVYEELGFFLSCHVGFLGFALDVKADGLIQ